MNDMVEKVARAICKERCGICSGYETFSQNDVVLARVAIEAMRDATITMAYAGSATQEDLAFGNALDVWEAMVDAALTSGMGNG